MSKSVIHRAMDGTEQLQKASFETRRMALYLWVGLLLAMTLFYVQGQIVFITEEPRPTSSFEWGFVFLGFITFLMGFVFFKNYTKVRWREIRTAKPGDRKQSLLLAFVFQFLLFETLGLYGVLVAVLTQNPWKAVPFIGAAYFGFVISFPKQEKISPFFEKLESSKA